VKLFLDVTTSWGQGGPEGFLFYVPDAADRIGHSCARIKPLPMLRDSAHRQGKRRRRSDKFVQQVFRPIVMSPPAAGGDDD
jgi:hypothetical protein